MKIVVIGGSGRIGSKVVENLRQHGHEVVAASPSTGVNTITGEGVAEAVKGADVVVDVANAPVWEDKAVLEFFETSGKNLLAAEATAGVKHHVALSVVGTERLLASGYFRAKLAQEALIKASPVPYTIVRATQFFEFVGGIAQGATEGDTVRVPAAMMQPMSRMMLPRPWRMPPWRSRRTVWSKRPVRPDPSGRTRPPIPGSNRRSSEGGH